MKRVKCIISYDGTDFEGYQIQPNKRTVQGELEKVLAKMHKGEQVRVFASGRTDAHVHALGQVIHFDSSLNIEEHRWIKALNALLPNDIVVQSAHYVESTFHARFSNCGKEYHYHILLSKEVNPFKRNYSYHYPYPLNIEMMKKAMTFIIGTHDFTSFCSAKTEVADHIRTIEDFQLTQSGEELIFKIRGNGFLYNMVRIIVGTVIEVGSGKRSASEIPSILSAKDRTTAGKTAPGHGLYLYKVYY